MIVHYAYDMTKYAISIQVKHLNISHFSVPKEKCFYLLENIENGEATYYRQLREIPHTYEKYVPSATGKGQLHQ